MTSHGVACLSLITIVWAMFQDADRLQFTKDSRAFCILIVDSTGDNTMNCKCIYYA